jgi:hypothetical protein
MVSPKQLARTKHLMRSLRGRFVMFFLSPHASLACMLCCSCTPIPLTKSLSGPAGVTKAGKVDPSFIEVGRTSRDELVRVFSWVDTGIKGDQLFWARWAFSDSGWVRAEKRILEKETVIQPWHRRAKSKVGSPREPHPEALV